MCRPLFPKMKSECTNIIFKNHVIIFEIIKLYLYHIYVVILFAQPIHVTLQYELEIYISSAPTQLGGGLGKLLRNSAIFEVLSYFLGTDDDRTSRSPCMYISHCFCIKNDRKAVDMGINISFIFPPL